MPANVEKWVKCDILPIDVSHITLDLRIHPPIVVGALLFLWANYAHQGPMDYSDEALARVAGFGNAGLWPSDSVRQAVLGHFRRDGAGCLVPLVVDEWVAKRQAVRVRGAKAARLRWNQPAPSSASDRKSASSARKQPGGSKRGAQ